MRQNAWLAAVLCLVFVVSCKEEKKESERNGASAPPSDSSDSKDTPTPTDPPVNPTPTNPACPKYPVVFQHGFMGGNRIGSFVGVLDHFKAKGCAVYRTEVSAVASVEQRAEQFNAQVTKILTDSKVEKVNIIAHSQGGLDARYSISTLGLGKSVASLSTLSTPHAGTAIADFAQGAASNQMLAQSMESLIKVIAGVANTTSSSDTDLSAAIKSLSTNYVTSEFNPKNLDVSGVYYQSWGARSGAGTGDKMKSILQMGHLLLKLKSGENDGVVPTSSSKWGTFRGVLDADHLDLLGLKLDDGAGAFKHLSFLETVLSELAAKGF